MENNITDDELQWIKDIVPKPDKKMMIQFARYCMIELITRDERGYKVIYSKDMDKLNSILKEYE